MPFDIVDYLLAGVILALLDLCTGWNELRQIAEERTRAGDNLQWCLVVGVVTGITVVAWPLVVAFAAGMAIYDLWVRRNV